jgi:RNA polymerase sigma factor (sigma-70 family)
MAVQTLADHSDRQLIERVLVGPDETAFQAIVYRHGPMVYRVCWRVLQQAQDTEDAFQATFLVLAQKLRALRRHTSLASWLHGVAHRVALRAKGQATAQRRRERHASRSEFLLPDEITWRELRSTLDRELSQLPDKWRLPLILCYLEGRAQDEAAQQLAWSKSTLRRRLEEARTALGTRLKRRGVTLPAALSAILVSDCLASPAPAAGLIACTVEAAAGVATGKTVTTAASATVAGLAQGVLNAMVLNQLKPVMVGLLAIIVVVGVGAGGFLYHAQGADTPGDASPTVQNQNQQGKRSADRTVAAELVAARAEVLKLRNKLEAVQAQLEAAQKHQREFADQVKDFLRTNHEERLKRERELKALQEQTLAKHLSADRLNDDTTDQALRPQEQILASHVTWRTDYAQARKEAAEKKLPVLVWFHESTPATDPAVDAETEALIRENFIPVKVPRESQLGKLMEVQHAPTIILADFDGAVFIKMESNLVKGILPGTIRDSISVAKARRAEPRHAGPGPPLPKPPLALPTSDDVAGREPEPAPAIPARVEKEAAKPALIVPENATITIPPDAKINLRPVRTSQGMRVRLEMAGLTIEAVRLHIDSNGKISGIQIGRTGEIEVRVLPKEQ